MPALPLYQQGVKLATKVIWASGTWIVFDISRMGDSRGNSGADIRPPAFFFARMQWDLISMSQDQHVNWDHMIEGLPPFLGKPSGPDFKLSNEQKIGLTRWGANQAPDDGGGGEVGAGTVDYVDGQTVRNLEFFNVGAIRKVPPYSVPAGQPAPPISLEFYVDIPPLEVIEPTDPSGPLAVFYIWGVPPVFGSGMVPLSGDPTFSGADDQPKPYYSAPYKIGEFNGEDITIPYVQAFHWRLTNASANLPPEVQPIPIAWPSSFSTLAAAQSVVDWAYTIGLAGGDIDSQFTLDARSAVVDIPPPEPEDQPEALITWSVSLYKGAGTFPYSAENEPLWLGGPKPLTPKQTITRTWGGIAPQPLRVWRIKYTAAQGLEVFDFI